MRASYDQTHRAVSAAYFAAILLIAMGSAEFYLGNHGSFETMTILGVVVFSVGMTLDYYNNEVR